MMTLAQIDEALTDWDAKLLLASDNLMALTHLTAYQPQGRGRLAPGESYRQNSCPRPPRAGGNARTVELLLALPGRRAAGERAARHGVATVAVAGNSQRN